MEDAELVGLAREGDKTAFGELIERYDPMVRRLTQHLIGRPEIAHELMQEAYLAAYLSLAKLHEATSFKSWLYGIVLNVCRSYRRSEGASLFSLETLAGGRAFDTIEFQATDPGPPEIAEARELHRLVLSAVGSLSPRNRAATLLFYYEGLSLPEIAATLGVSVGAVKGRLHKARQELRTRLWPLYAEDKVNSPKYKKRSEPMVKVSILDVVPSQEDDKIHYAVVLHDQAGQRLLPIWVGRFEGEAIAAGLRQLPALRPLTFDFLLNIMQSVGASLEEVRIEVLKDSTFYAVARLRSTNGEQELDARPSDALALAVRTGCPVQVAEAVFEQAGFPIPADQTASSQGLEQISQQWQAEQSQWKAQAGGPLDPVKIERNRQQLLEALFQAPA